MSFPAGLISRIVLRLCSKQRVAQLGHWFTRLCRTIKVRTARFPYEAEVGQLGLSAGTKFVS